MHHFDDPYDHMDHPCTQDKKVKKVLGIYSNQVESVLPNDAGQLKAALVMGPVAAAVAADKEVFRFHDGKKAIKSESCGVYPNHQIVAVGYGIEKDDKTGEETEYVIIKNSHGTDWGDQGYGKISLSQEHRRAGICGILGVNSSYAKVKNTIGLRT